MPQPGLRPAAVALRATQNSGLPCSSDRRAPDPSRQSADGCALWSRLVELCNPPISGRYGFANLRTASVHATASVKK